jgi:hypothetical protein
MCAELAKDGRLNAQTLVDVNRPEDAPLHSCFEWNDVLAAEEWREHQARNIINSITVVTMPGQEPVRAYFNIHTKLPNYESVQAIVQQEDKYQLLLEMAKKELSAFTRKYKQLSELSKVFDAINELGIDAA